MRSKTLLAIMAHPDDESMGFGVTLATYGQNPDVKTHLITITRGQKGTLGDPKLGVTRKMLPVVREKELRCAASKLGLDTITILNYEDGELPAVEETIAQTHIVRLINKIKPQVVITHGPEGDYGHPDHVAVSGWVSKAVNYAPKVSKLYHPANQEDFTAAFGKVVGHIKLGSFKLAFKPHPQKYATTTLDGSKYAAVRFAALECYQTQKSDADKFVIFKQLGVKSRITHDYYHLAFARGNFTTPETDLFAGI